MARGLIVSISVLLCSMGAWASQPGQRLDCSDWVFLQPGYACVPITGSSCVTSSGQPGPCGQLLASKVFDNQGRLFAFEGEVLGDCGGVPTRRTSLKWFDGQGWNVLAHVDDRCVVPGLVDGFMGGFGGTQVLLFDDKNGRLMISVADECRSFGQQCLYPGNGIQDPWIAEIVGFATTFEILQTYTPPSTLSFRVPYMPEGLREADHFDTYWGRVSDLPNFTRAQPLRCDYPSTPPHVGDYLTVADTSPTPAAGQGNYIVTAVTSGPQRRYGRQRIWGVLSGRDPALLPACSESKER